MLFSAQNANFLNDSSTLKIPSNSIYKFPSWENSREFSKQNKYQGNLQHSQRISVKVDYKFWGIC